MSQGKFFTSRENLRDKNNATAMTVETLRNVSSLPALVEPPAKSEENVSWFWKIFGGTILSIVALVIMTAYTQMTSSLAELRRDLSQMQEARGDLIRKDELNTRVTALWSAFKEMQTSLNALTALNERFKVLDVHLDKQLRGSDDDRRELIRKIEDQRRLVCDEHKDVHRKLEDQLRQLQTLAERMASLEGRHAGTTAAKTAPSPSTLKKLARPITGG
ncbi:MAG: hypothetical protein FJ271_26260 [Planctomycetes bacterium]|nr:hypothetical protein [Planctomycetota bacterium]